MILWGTVERLSDEVKTEFEQLHKDFENVTKRDTKTIGERLKIVASKIAFLTSVRMRASSLLAMKPVEKIRF